MMRHLLEEVQGLYGAFTLSERVLQKIWLRQDFDVTALRTVSGKSLQVLETGRWNLLDGADFKEARLVIDAVERVSDVEVHFYNSDWDLHGHASNPSFSGVGLHVVLYPPREGEEMAQTAKGEQPELLCLLPLLERDLEAYAIEDALLEFEQIEQAPWILEFMQKPQVSREGEILDGARVRWEQKRSFAKKRISGSSWSEACHQFCLEVLGYARNRAPMSRIALSHSLEDFASTDLDVDALYAEKAEAWRLSGLRPANHPRRRLQQYAQICQVRSDWPERLLELMGTWHKSEADDSTAAFRKRANIPVLLKELSAEVFDDQISAKRLNTLVCDALLPLADAAGVFDAEDYWLHWPGGDAPEILTRFLKEAQLVDRTNPLSNGLLQGALALSLRR